MSLTSFEETVKYVYNHYPSPPDIRNYLVDFPENMNTAIHPYTKEAIHVPSYIPKNSPNPRVSTFISSFNNPNANFNSNNKPSPPKPSPPAPAPKPAPKPSPPKPSPSPSPSPAPSPSPSPLPTPTPTPEPETKVRAYSLSSFFKFVFNQGPLGSCTSNAGCQYYGFLLRMESIPFSRLMHYWYERSLQGNTDKDSGATVKDAVKVMCKIGICPEVDWPYDISKFTQKPPASALDEIIPLPVGTNYMSVSIIPSQFESALLSGKPIMIGIYVFSGFESAQTSKTGVVPYPTSAQTFLGGHCILITGYDSVQQQFQFLNSWGNKWGNAGYGYLPYCYLTSPFMIRNSSIRLVFDAWIVVMQ